MGSRDGRQSLAGEGRGPNEDKSSWGQWQQPRQEPGAPKADGGLVKMGPAGSTPLDLQLPQPLAFMPRETVKSANRAACGRMFDLPPRAGVGNGF